MPVYLITGGAGFVGSHLAIRLKQSSADARVIALDNLRRRGSELNLPRLREHGIEFLHGDVRQPADIAAAGPVDAILECSAEPSVLAGYGDDPAYVIDTNLGGMLSCLEHARRCGAAILFLSTSRVYPVAHLNQLRLRETDTRFELETEQDLPGVSTRGIAEDFPLTGARSLYGATKLAGELFLQEYVAMYGLRGVVNRCGVLAGPWQMGRTDQGVITLWVARHHFGGSLRYIGFGGAGKQVRDVLHVDDLFELVHWQLDHLDAINGQTFNVGGGRACSVSLRELTDLCRDLTGRTIPVDPDLNPRPADMPLYLTDNSRVTAATGWRPTRTMEDILGDIHRWIRAHEGILQAVLA